MNYACPDRALLKWCSTVSTTQTFHLVEITPEIDLNPRHSRYTLSCFCHSWSCLYARTGHTWYLFCETAVKETPVLAMVDDKKPKEGLMTDSKYHTDLKVLVRLIQLFFFYSSYFALTVFFFSFKSIIKILAYLV